MRFCPGSEPTLPLLAGALALSLTAISCARPRPAEHAPVGAPPGAAAPSRRVVHPARWFPIVDSSEPRLVEQDPDGSLRLVERGLRLVEHPDGRIVRAEQILPSDGTIAVLHLPARLGGGNVFSVTSEGSTRLFRAPGWTSPLAPLVRLPFEAAELVAGFDRLYAVSLRTHAVVGIDVASGSLIGAGPLPPAAAYGPMAFSDGWVGAVEVDVRGVLVTFDAGASYHPLRARTTTPAVSEQGGQVVLGTTEGAFLLEPSGELERAPGQAEGAIFGALGPSPEGLTAEQDDTPEGEPVLPVETFALGARPLEVAVLRGYPDSADSAVVVANGTLARVGLADGHVLASAPHAVPPEAACVGVPLFTGGGFVCGEPLGPTRIYAYRAPLTLDPVVELPGPRTVAPGGAGTLTVHGACPGGDASAPGMFCLVGPGAGLRQIRVEGYGGTERVVALADGRIVILAPPRHDFAGAIQISGGGGAVERRALSLAAVPTGIRELVAHGLWLDGVSQIEPGALSGWVVGGMSFVGVRVSLDGKVTAGTVRGDAPRASFAGPLALVTDPQGGGYETIDGGSTWTEIALPVRSDVVADAPLDRERGCSAVGCGLGSWLRVGWGKGGGGRGPPDLSVAADPPKPAAEPVTYVTWSLGCTPTGETEGPADVARQLASFSSKSSAPPTAPRPDAAGVTDTAVTVTELESSSWRTFLGGRGPDRSPSDLGFDFGTEDQQPPFAQLRGYAWGERGAAWDRTGSFLVRVADRFTVRGSVWSTSVSRSPWPDAATAAEAFGSEPSHRITNDWRAVLDPLEEGGILSVRTGPTTELSLIERDRPVVPLHNVDDVILETLAGAVKVSGRWYVGTVPGPRSVHVLGVDGGSLSILGSYPRHEGDAEPHVVRTARGDALGLWVIAHGQRGTAGGGDTWLIHPLDTATGEAGEPLVVPSAALAHAPRPCDPDETGWLLGREVSPSIAKVEFLNVAETPAVTRLEARLIAGPRGLCLDALAAEVDGDPPKKLTRARVGAAHEQRGASLALTDRATDRRWGFRCVP